jgi:hypothetical protein
MPEALDLAFPITGRFLDGGHEDADMDAAMQLRSYWAEEWTTVLSRQSITEEESTLERDRIVKGVKAVLAEHDEFPETQQAIVVAIARLTYRGRHTEARRNEDGSVRSFPDGLLWSNYVANIYIDAMRTAGLTGLYVAVHFDRWSGGLRHSTCKVEVLPGGKVRRHDDAFAIGSVHGEEVQPGLYTMQYGLICVQEPSAELRMGSAAVDEDAFEDEGKEDAVSFV